MRTGKIQTTEFVPCSHLHNVRFFDEGGLECTEWIPHRRGTLTSETNLPQGESLDSVGLWKTAELGQLAADP